MRISFSPQRRDDVLSVTKSGDTLTINGEAFDFSDLPEGSSIPRGEVPCPWVFGEVSRVDGSIRICLILPHGGSPADEVAFPPPIIDPPDGIVAIPADQKEAEDVEG